MANKNIQIKDLKGNLLFPKTRGSLVFNDKNEALGTVEAGAQVNKIEKIKLNGVELSVVSKEVNIELKEGSEYSIIKQATPESGYSATYQLTKDSVAIGEKINIPKDMVVQSGSVQEVIEPDQPVAGYKVGEKYIDLVLANADLSHVYILVNDLVDIYTAGAGITINGREISADINGLSGTFVKKTDVYTKTETDGLLAAKADKATTLAGYGIQDAYTKTEVDGKVDVKADKATTLAGYGIGDAYTKGEVDTLLSNLITYEELV